MASIEIDGKKIQVEVGRMLIEASDAAGIYIPRFCYHEKLSIAANCRMCLVEVENAPKPLPACATPITDGMVVFTNSKVAREAQQGTLEFLLINHPLDCPVCDQGGECPLQDQAMHYGKDDSRYHERKRALPSHDIGPLIATEMTRCIHCTRCVRFGEEIAGIMEMGMPGRGESAWIGTFLNRSVDSEVSGNMIDLCPVGALTAKPSRFAARAWELRNHHGVSPHDCVGANLNIQTLRGRVERVLPRDNAQVNDCWLADRDRYSYQAVNSEQRLSSPMLKHNGQWQKVSWKKALERACAGISKVITSNGADEFAALAGYISTREEYYLLQKLVRALGSNNIDHRLQQSDFRDDAVAAAFPASELPIDQYQTIQSALLVGSNLRKEQPLLALRLRAAANASACVHSIIPFACEQNFAVQNTITDDANNDMATHLAALAAEIATSTGKALPDKITAWRDNSTNDSTKAHRLAMANIAQNLLQAGSEGVIILGAFAQQHADASVINSIAQWICQALGSRLSILAPGNSAAAWQVGCIPHRDAAGVALSAPGSNATEMFARARRAYLLLATEPEVESIDGNAAADALQNAEFVVSITAYQSDAVNEYADVLLPMASFTESAGTFVNCEGRVQYADAATSPLGESRPAWKILRVLGNFFDLPNFDYVSMQEVGEEIDANVPPSASAPSARKSEWEIPSAKKLGEGVKRLLDMPMYRGDQIVRNANALQKTADNPPPAARMNQAMIAQLGMNDSIMVSVESDINSVKLPLLADERIPADCVYVSAGYAQTIPLGGHGWVKLKKAQ